MPETPDETIKRLENTIESYKKETFSLRSNLEAERKKRFELEDYVHSIAKFVKCAQDYIDRGCS